MTPAPPAPMAPKKSGLPAVVIVLLVLGVGCVPITGILAAIAIPNFIKFQSRSKQSECRTYLKALYIAEKSYFADKNKFSPSMKEIGFAPDPKLQRYSYFLTPTEVSPATAPDALSSPSALAALRGHGVTPAASDTQFLGACVGNIDRDEAQDIWSISSEDRTGRNGEPVPAGTPDHEVDDLLE